MKKRWTALLLALALAAALLPAPAYAAAPDHSAGGRLTGVNRTVYDCLKTEIGKVSAGKRSDTRFRIPNQSALSWTTEELDGTGDLKARVKTTLQNALDMQLVYGCLMVDCPNELFWSGNSYNVSYSWVEERDRVTVKDLTVTVQPSGDYRGSGSGAVDPNKVSRAGQALDNARDIVKKHEGKSDYDKLAAYRDEICRLVSYDESAGRRGATGSGDPWQAPYVFDLDPGTNVVCEGYAKAFKYLCDLSRFQGDVTCRIAFGTMDGERHMWNVVRMGDGKNYLVDVTNLEAGAIGQGGELFLSGGTASEGGETYAVKIGCWEMDYTYDPVMEGMFAGGYLPLNGSDYVDTPAPPPAQPQDPAAPAFTDVPAGEYYAQPVAWAVEHEITRGTSAATFSPDQPCTHAQILTFLWRAMGEPTGTGAAPGGVNAGDYYYEAVCWASGLEMLQEGFDPGAGCSRADAMWYIWNAARRPRVHAASAFRDVPADSPYADAVNWAVSREITRGTSQTTFDPRTICTRGQIVTFLWRSI